MHTTCQKYFHRHPPDGPHQNPMRPMHRITPHTHTGSVYMSVSINMSNMSHQVHQIRCIGCDASYASTMMPASCDSPPPRPVACTAGVMGLVARVAPLPRVATYRECCGWAWLGLAEGRGGGRAWLRGEGAAGPGQASLYCSSCVLVLRCHYLARSRAFTAAGRQRSSEWL